VPHLELTHLAGSAARFVTGWELLHDARSLTTLGPGRFELDLVRGFCRHGSRWIPSLVIGGILRSRIEAALAEVELPWTILTQAMLQIQAQIELREAGAGARSKRAWAGAAGTFVFCTLDVTLVLTTAEGSWTGRHRGMVDWPRDWALRAAASR
jgi:hypothetical protein